LAEEGNIMVCKTFEDVGELCVELTRGLCFEALEDAVGRDRVGELCERILTALVLIVDYAKRMAG
jgi:hypothetical protein